MSGRHYSLVGNVALPDKLSPEDLDELVDLTVLGNFGTGRERIYRLGKWYDTVQCIVNCKLPHYPEHYNIANRLSNKFTSVLFKVC